MQSINLQPLFSSYSLSSGSWPDPATLASHRLPCWERLSPPLIRQGLAEVVTHKSSNVFCGFQEKSVCPLQEMEIQFQVNQALLSFQMCLGETDKSTKKKTKNKAIVCVIACVEECSCVNNHPLLCPDPVCCQGKPRLFARQKNSPQERRIHVSLLSLFKWMIAVTKFSCL